MNAQKLTEKSLEAIQSANDMAISHQNQMIQQVHLLCALLEAGERLDSAAVLKRSAFLRKLPFGIWNSKSTSCRP